MKDGGGGVKMKYRALATWRLAFTECFRGGDGTYGTDG